MGSATEHLSGKEYYAKRQACIALTILSSILLLIILGTIYSTLLKPEDASARVLSVTLNAPPVGLIRTAQTGSPPGVNLTLLFLVSVHNPNRATFRSDDSKAALFYHGNAQISSQNGTQIGSQTGNQNSSQIGGQVGYLYIPPFNIRPRTTLNMAIGLATTPDYSIQESTLLQSDIDSGELFLASTITISGRVTTLNIFPHYGSTTSQCNIHVSLTSKTIQDYVC